MGLFHATAGSEGPRRGDDAYVVKTVGGVKVAVIGVTARSRSGRRRDLMVEYFGARHVLPGKPDDNWRLVPPAAVGTLVREEATVP